MRRRHQIFTSKNYQLTYSWDNDNSTGYGILQVYEKGNKVIYEGDTHVKYCLDILTKLEEGCPPEIAIAMVNL